MRNLLLFSFFIFSIDLIAKDFIVFEQNGYFGIKDDEGQVTVPAVYEKLGWSNGSTQVHNGFIGFRKNRLWGLISVKNKLLTPPKFTTIEPVLSAHFKASVKGKFSNYLFHGILNEKRETIISFNYFTIEPLGDHWSVSLFNGKRQQFGVVSFDNELIIPIKYVAITERGQLLVGKQLSQRLDIYSRSGQRLQAGLDSIIYQKGWIAYRDGYAGYLSESGKVIYDFAFKKITITDEKTSLLDFPEWTIYQQDSMLLKWKCDSLTVSENEMLVAYVNGAHHWLLKDGTRLDNHKLILKKISEDQLIAQNTETQLWSVLDKNGQQIISGYDSIYTIGSDYACLNTKGWNLIDRKGKARDQLPLQVVMLGLDGQRVAKRNHHWGIIDRIDEGITIYKYDSIITTKNDYLIFYLNRWGVLNQKEEWIIRSEFNEITALGNVLIGRRGKGYTVFHKGEVLYKTISKPLSEIGTHILIEGEKSKLGLMNQSGKEVVRPKYDTIRIWAGHFELVKKGRITLRTAAGHSILNPMDGYQEVKGYGDDYFVVKKENKWGFVDEQGRLRISNRYDDARPFSEGLAPISLRGKWGFIDKSEKIRVQPYYQEVAPFHNGRAIVQVNQKYGLVDENGEEVLDLIWKSIQRLNTGNYLVRDMGDQVGLVNEKGSFIYRPSFHYLADFGDRILVFKNNAWGVLGYDGQPIFDVTYESIKIKGKYTMIKN